MSTVAPQAHHVMKGKTVFFDYYVPITARKTTEFEGVILAVTNGSFGPLAIIEFEHEGQTHVIDVHLARVRIKGTLGLSEQEAMLLRSVRILGNGGRLNVFYQHADYPAAQALEKHGLIKMLSMVKSPDGYATFALTDEGETFDLDAPASVIPSE
ncbi:hypothetical protein HOT99_gp195 [Caulobacter phage CcrBL10]|uniref:Uncharacterized protein n=1 Tax=Caulobacter phage CcrBL10 TaxID=2283269 RepID=A0A385EC33_9CAUD|nr:hypothetical protein HOT99_gp195 [Caulobacter phage CcrBL10]AXQ68422.1 hypothetical protein CcrBL10_gp218c [Caulobacter phage CcrBL10]